MKNFKMKALSALIFLPALSFAHATEQPKAEDLVGKFYVGLHGAMMDADNDRLDYLNTDFKSGKGLGAEVGYRFSPELEFRFSYTDLTFDVDRGYSDEDGGSLSVDALYFINQKSLYLIGGLNNLNIEETELSATLGAGYRYYFADNFAAYAEGKADYQFEDHYVDYTGQVGIMYFFGETKKSLAPRQVEPSIAKSEPAKALPVVAEKDTDLDGVVDSIDQCENTPTTDKVDGNGCTILSEETLTQSLLINFDNNEAVIKPEYYADVEKLAKFLNQYPNVSVVIGGHTSSQGSAKYNQTLSQKRADAVVALLVNKYEISAKRLEAKGFGESQLINPANTQKAHNENRRIEAVVNVKKSTAVKR